MDNYFNILLLISSILNLILYIAYKFLQLELEDLKFEIKMLNDNFRRIK